MAQTTKQRITCPITGQSYTKISHRSGLDILVWKMEGFSTTDVLFGTKYGSVNTVFKTRDDDEYITVPEGIAHFLEHKLFENEDSDVFELFAKTGANANAYTSFDKTCYLFNCSENWEKSLEILLGFVQEPYFTKETVDKEQGIIGQEIRMCDDNPYRAVFFNLLKAAYKSHPVRIDIAGTVESIAKIDADLLYKCYYSFYNLSNMVLSLAGNVDEDAIIEICDRLLKPCENNFVKSVMPFEPLEVSQPEIRQKMLVGSPLFCIGFKSKPESGRELLKAEIETGIAISLLADSSSALYNRMLCDGLINSSFYTEIFDGEGYFLASMGGESRNPALVLEEICSEIEKCKVNGLDSSRFEELKKSFYGTKIREWDNVEAISNGMLAAYFNGVTQFDVIDILSRVTFDDVQRCFIERFDTDNRVLSVVSAD